MNFETGRGEKVGSRSGRPVAPADLCRLQQQHASEGATASGPGQAEQGGDADGWGPWCRGGRLRLFAA